MAAARSRDGSEPSAATGAAAAAIAVRLGRAMSRRELAETVNARLFADTGREFRLGKTSIGKLERDEHRWPNERLRAALCARGDSRRVPEAGHQAADGRLCSGRIGTRQGG
jgi:hypothetical protein